MRTTLLCRTAEQATELNERGENERYLPGVRAAARAEGARARRRARTSSIARTCVFLAVPSKGLAEALAELKRQGVASGAGVVSLAKGLVPPDGVAADARARGRVRAGPRGVHRRARARARDGHRGSRPRVRFALGAARAPLRRACSSVPGVVCEVSDDPVGVELAGCAKNAAAVAVGATEAQGLNAAGMAASDIFSEVAALAESRGGQVRTFLGRAGTGDLVATALAPKSRNRSAGELLSQGVPAAEIPERLGQAVEALETVPLLARAIESAGIRAPVTSALARLVAGELPLDDWVRLVRAEQPEPARFRGRLRGWWRRLVAWFRRR